MDDSDIIGLYWARDEAAISETSARYGAYLGTVAYQILDSREDADECVNDTYLRAWNSMPPQKPDRLRLYLAKITRSLSIDRWRGKTAEKRRAGEYAASLDELAECVEELSSVEDEAERHRLAETVNDWLGTLGTEQRTVFVCRYWYCDPLSAIAESRGCTEAKIKSMLYRLRQSLRETLIREEFSL